MPIMLVCLKKNPFTNGKTLSLPRDETRLIPFDPVLVPEDTFFRTKSLPDEKSMRQMTVRPAPYDLSQSTNAQKFNQASSWTQINLERAGVALQKHGDRNPNGGWPKATGRQKDKEFQARKETDKILFSEATLREYRFWKAGKKDVVDYRELHPKGLPSQGRGVRYSNIQLEGFLNEERIRPKSKP
jgi:hypothetical protein